MSQRPEKDVPMAAARESCPLQHAARVSTVPWGSGAQQVRAAGAVFDRGSVLSSTRITDGLSSKVGPRVAGGVSRLSHSAVSQPRGASYSRQQEPWPGDRSPLVAGARSDRVQRSLIVVAIELDEYRLVGGKAA